MRLQGCRNVDRRQSYTSNPEALMQWAGEPKLEEVLSDPIVRAVMERDRVDPEKLRLLLRDATKLLAALTGDATNGNATGKAPDASADYLAHNNAPAPRASSACEERP
jgi:hypothetical protein